MGGGEGRMEREKWARDLVVYGVGDLRGSCAGIFEVVFRALYIVRRGI